MILLKRSSLLLEILTKERNTGKRIGFVPTMGALHPGHLSLIQEARRKTDLVVCSIFVNPTQFNQPSDLESYPRTPGRDIRLLLDENCDFLFHPTVKEMYEGDFTLQESSGLGTFLQVLEGSSRPGHFDGVVTVVDKLFRKVRPDEVFFGQKDFQQCMVVEALIRNRFPEIHFNRCPTAREADGLAMSSRNVRLTVEERAVAPRIFEVLSELKRNWNPLSWEAAIANANKQLNQLPFKLEYLKVCDPTTLQVIDKFTGQAVVLVALWLGETRLIDNLMLYDEPVR